MLNDNIVICCKRDYNYPLFPHSYNFRPDKLHTINLGRSSSPEGWCDCVCYVHNNKNSYEFMSLGWTIDEDKYLWMKFLTYSRNEFYNPSIDVVLLELVHQETEHCMGWGKEFFFHTFDNIDKAFEFIKNHHILRDFFFQNEIEKNNLMLFGYKERKL